MVSVLLLCENSIAQENDSTSKPTTLGLVAASLAPAATIGIAFGQNYYDFWKSNNQVPFHISPDPPYALHSDKLGHAMYSYLCADVTKYCYIQAGVSPLTSAWLGFGSSLLAQTMVEIGDGIHGNADYFGFSPGDEAADVIGSFLPVAQVYVPYLNHFQYKLGVWPSDVYHKGTFRGLLDDNESQFFWLAMDIHEYMGDWFPKWISPAIGYGVTDLKSSAFLPARAGAVPKSLFYIGLDLNVKNLPFEGKVWNVIAQILSYYHFPLPALQVGPIVKWHWLKP
jgi:hypothetical protein